MQFRTWALAAVACAGLSGCGDNFAEQGLIGAGAGTAAAVVLDGSVFTGAVVGAAGNLLYCQTNPGQCN